MRSCRWALTQYDLIRRERHDGCLHTEERPCEDIVRRLPYTRQEDRPQKIPTMQTPWSCISSLLNCEEINFRCSSHPDPVCGILLCSPSRRIHQPISLILLHFQKVHSFNIHHNICKFSKLWHLDACLRRKTEVSLIPNSQWTPGRSTGNGQTLFSSRN